MTNFRNLKIAINDQQPLDEVVKFLISGGYRKSYDWNPHLNTKWVQTRANGCISNSEVDETPYCSQTTTLSELKEM